MVYLVLVLSLLHEAPAEKHAECMGSARSSAVGSLEPT